MQPLVVVEVEVGCKARLGLPDRLVALQVDLLVLHGPPEALDEDIVPHPAAAALANKSVGVGPACLGNGASWPYRRRITFRIGLTRYQSNDWSPSDLAINPGGKGNSKAISKPPKKNR